MGSMKFLALNEDADGMDISMDIVKLFPLGVSTIVLDNSILRNRSGSAIVLFPDKMLHEVNEVEQSLCSLKCHRCHNLHGLYLSVCPWCSYSRSCTPIQHQFNPYIRKADMLPQNTVVLNYDRPSRSFSGMTPTTAPLLAHGVDCICYLKPVVSWTSQKPKTISYNNELLNASEKAKEERKARTMKKAKNPTTITASLAPKQVVKRENEEPTLQTLPQKLPSFSQKLPSLSQKLPSLSHLRKSFDDPDFYSSDFTNVKRNFILKRNKNIVILKAFAMLMLLMMFLMLVCLLVNNVTLSKVVLNKNVCSTDGHLYNLHSEINKECGKYLK